jgi:GAF domain-containing protein
LLRDPPDNRPGLIDTALAAVLEVIAADGALLIEWLGERPTVMGSVGTVPEMVHGRPPEGATLLRDQPVAVTSVDSHRDLLAVRRHGAPSFDSTDLLALDAVAALLHHADVWNPRETTSDLYRLATEVLQTLDLDQVLLSLANAAGRLLSAEVAGIFLVEDDVLHMRCAVGHRSPQTAQLRIEPGHGVAGKVVETGLPQRVDDYVTNTSISKEYLGIALEEGTQSALCVPMFDMAGQITGVLGVWRRRRSIFLADDEQLLVALSGLAAIAVQNARLFQLQRVATEQLQRAQDALEERLRAADLALRVHQELTRIAIEGKDVEALASAVHRLLGGAVVLLARDGRHLAAHPVAAASDFVLDDGDQADGERSYWFTKDSTSWTVSPVKAGGTRYGHLCLGLDAPPTTPQLVAGEQAATVCALLLARQEAIEAATTRLQSEFVWDLLEGRVTGDDETIQGTLRTEHGVGLPVRLLLVHAEGFKRLASAQGWSPEELDRARNWLAQRLARRLEDVTRKGVMVGHRGDDLAILVTPRSDDIAAAREVGLAILGESPFPSVQLRAGISRPACTASAMRSSLREAVLAMNATGSLRGRVVVFDDLGILQFLLAPTNGEDLEAFAQSVLGPLAEYDRRRGTELMSTLDAYLESGCAVAESARRLHLHAKSLRYRLKRIFELTGLDLESREERLRAELALRVLGPVAKVQSHTPAPYPLRGDRREEAGTGIIGR